MITESEDDVELPEADIEWIYEAHAKCPNCNDPHSVSTCDSGVIECECGTKFFWQTGY